MPPYTNTYVGLRSETQIPNGTGAIVTVPIFTMFISPEELLRLAEVPSFSPSSDHKGIAINLKTPPTKEWQRPLNEKRVEDIGNYFGSSSAKRMMANPILLGESSHSSNNNNASIEVNQLMHQGQAVNQDVYEIKLSNNGRMPLWILDGQHRSYGLGKNANTKSRRIPVVILAKSAEYSMEFLAQIFTEVTTKAEALEPIHDNWMKYSFGMPDFHKGLSRDPMNSKDKGLRCTIELVSMGSIDGTSNEFFDNIKFNPEDENTLSTFNITWDSIDWGNLISKYYYDNGGVLDHTGLTKQIVRFLRAAKKLDSHSSTDSRLFGTTETVYTVLLNHLVWQFLLNLDSIGHKSQADWESHLKTHNWHNSDWSLPWTKPNANTSSHWGRYSNRAAEYVFRRIMSSSPLPVTPDLALKGSSELSIHGYAKTPGGSISKTNAASETVQNLTANINGGGTNWTTGANRTVIQFKVPSNGLGSIVKGSVNWKDGAGQTDTLSVLATNTKTQTLHLDGKTAPIEIKLQTCSFSDKAIRNHQFEIQW